MKRLESLSANARNAKRKPGVTFEKSALNGKWVVRAIVGGRLTTMGGFDTEAEAEHLWEQLKTNQTK